MTRLTARQKFALNKRPEVDGVLSIIDGVRFKPVKGGAAQPAASRATIFPATTLSARVDDEKISSLLSFQDDEVLDIAWPYSFSFADAKADGVYVYTLKSLSVRDVRGLITRPMPRMFDFTLSKWKPGMSVGESYSTIFGMIPGGEPQVISNMDGREFTGAHPREFIQGLASFQLSSEYDWHVVVGSVEGRSVVKVPCSPQVALDFLSLRDIAAGKQRRSALRHWVRGYTRVTQDDRDVDVREHLRGRTYFKWDDLKGYIEPSAYDLRKAGA